MKITVMSTRSNGWWSSTSDGIPGFVTQTRSLAEIREYAQDIAALSGFSAREVEEVEVDVHVVGELGKQARAA
ncbi:hypothetical protein CATRI_04005 [Corynebacterium atrinae]|uniref:hypothetical protein n=1 Tax=Corynebacterium atrinae TaxID=1336740 RepID=UPI0025B48BC0|nr:hypothetical protein [Corynebacterium atrinae]WJY62899.1 hypothetical protein CATRI_04005 [Corynebacterium atrinae]